jgi:hypothetical protein
MPMPITIDIFPNAIKPRGAHPIDGMVNWPNSAGGGSTQETLAYDLDAGLLYFYTTLGGGGGLERQSTSFRDDDFGYFDGMDNDTVLRWFTGNEATLPPGGPLLAVNVSNSDLANIEIGICNQGLTEENTVTILFWVPTGMVGMFAPSDNIAGTYGVQFPSPNPVTGDSWTVGDLIRTPINQPIGPSWPQPTVFYIKELVDGDYRTNMWYLCAGQTIWFLPEIDSLDVVQGPTVGGTTVVISGTSLFSSAYSPSEIQAFFGETEAVFVDLTWNPTVHLLTVTTPAHVEGYVDVLVRCWYPDGGSEEASLGGAFLYTDGGPTPPAPDIQITGSGGVLVGAVSGSTPAVLSADVSGMYTLIPDRHFDRIYTKNTDPAQTTDVAIPTPFAKTGYFGA